MSAKNPKLLNVLVVEDNGDDQTLIAYALRGKAINLKMVASAEAAVDLLNSGERFDVVVSDLNMPRGSGLDLLKYMLESGLPSTVFVLHTDAVHSPRVQEAKKLSAKFVPKSATMDELGEFLSILLKTLQGGRPASI